MGSITSVLNDNNAKKSGYHFGGPHTGVPLFWESTSLVVTRVKIMPHIIATALARGIFSTVSTAQMVISVVLMSIIMAVIYIAGSCVHGFSFLLGSRGDNGAFRGRRWVFAVGIRALWAISHGHFQKSGVPNIDSIF